jgi:hypothetical protein
MLFKVMHFIEVQKFFSPCGVIWISKEAEFYADSKNINLP